MTEQEWPRCSLCGVFLAAHRNDDPKHLRAERDALAEALREIDEHPEAEEPTGQWAQRIARAALDKLGED